MGPPGGQCRPKRTKWRVVEADLCRPSDAKLGAPVDRSLRASTVERRGGSGRTRVRLAQTCLLREGGLTCPDPPPDLNNRGKKKLPPEGGELASACHLNGSRVGRCAQRGGFHTCIAYHWQCSPLSEVTGITQMTFSARPPWGGTPCRPPAERRARPQVMLAGLRQRRGGLEGMESPKKPSRRGLGQGSIWPKRLFIFVYLLLF